MRIVQVISAAEHLSRLVNTAGLAWLLASALGLSGPDPIAAVVGAGISTPVRAQLPAPATATGTPIYVASATGVVDNVMAGYIEEAVKRASDAGGRAARAGSTHRAEPRGDPAHRLLAARIAGAHRCLGHPERRRAASAGTFITLAADLAYMAPGRTWGGLPGR